MSEDIDLLQQVIRQFGLGELETVTGVLEKAGFGEQMRVDFSILNDTDYYNGLLFRGFADGVARPVLSGGRYDHLLHRMGRSGSAVGFAVYLSELESLLWEDEETAATVLEYGPEDDPAAVAAAAKAAAERGSVRVQLRGEGGVTCRRKIGPDGKEEG